MATQSITIDLPEEIVSLLGSPDSAPAAAKRAIVLELLREGRISQGKASEILGISRWAMMDLIAEHEIPSGPQTAEEMAREIETIRRVTRALD